MEQLFWLCLFLLLIQRHATPLLFQTIENSSKCSEITHTNSKSAADFVPVAFLHLAEPRGIEGTMVMPPSSRGHPSCHWQLDLMGSIPRSLIPPNRNPRRSGGFYLVDLKRFELSTPTMRMWCAPSCATSPCFSQLTLALYTPFPEMSRKKI